ncbi:MAG: DUF1684 domain-containing protein [Bacteroidota bacterium]|nr:DUF1684 domain-containing protein [Ferruginibacter sp.]
MKTAPLVIAFIIVCCSATSYSQANYLKQVRAFRADYIMRHEVVKGKDKSLFRFFPLDSTYRVSASFEKITDTIGFSMKTSAGTTQDYFKYGKVSFALRDTVLELFIYQSKKLRYTTYKDYLFIPFTDNTTGDLTYAAGRYIDLLITDIKNNRLTVDFNKAYNPYCAYAPGYHCPLPPRENFAPMAIKAGEKTFAGKNH